MNTPAEQLDALMQATKPQKEMAWLGIKLKTQKGLLEERSRSLQYEITCHDEAIRVFQEKCASEGHGPHYMEPPHPKERTAGFALVYCAICNKLLADEC